MRRSLSKLEQLEDFLLNLPDDDEGLLIEGLDGFVAGIIVCPDLIMPSRWLPQIWGQNSSDQDAPVFDGPEEAQAVLGLIMDHYNTVAKSLNEGRGGYQPLFAIDPCNNKDILWEIWIEGFSRAMALSPGSWISILESEDRATVAALKGLQTLNAIAERESSLPKDQQDRLTRQAPDLIPEWVERLNAWRLTGTGRRTVMARPPYGKVGRNEPCPCGSGKKYKKCCGLN